MLGVLGFGTVLGPKPYIFLPPLSWSDVVKDVGVKPKPEALKGKAIQCGEHPKP